MVTALERIGYHPTSRAKDADLMILNTCSVRAKAEEKIYSILFTMKGQLKLKPGLLIGVGGCVAQQEGEKLLAKVPHLHFVFGTHNLHLLPQMVREAEAGRRMAETGFIDSDTRFDLFPASGEERGISRFVTIMQGCDNFCSYCIVPYVRGREVSRRAADILAEIRQLASVGTREITLLGQNVNSYGLAGDSSMDFAGLLRNVAAIDGIERIRFMTSHPKDISRPLMDCFADLEKLCSHAHLPAQAGSDRILALMNRGYTRREYLAKVALLRQARPHIQVTGDIIVGFPGETEEDFRQTLSLMEEVDYADSFSFSYSPRPETKAASLPDQVSRGVKQERLERVLALQRELTARRNRSLVGSTQQVLVDGFGKRSGQVSGRTSGNLIVNFSAPADLIGRLVDVNIVHAYQNSLGGELASPAR
jgi:tRNA-2-methylthio-N6-dimethylallyladenosine synthase